MSAVRCLISGLYQPECGCLSCLREQVVNQLRRNKTNRSKENT